MIWKALKISIKIEFSNKRLYIQIIPLKFSITPVAKLFFPLEKFPFSSKLSFSNQKSDFSKNTKYKSFLVLLELTQANFLHLNLAVCLKQLQ
ncbi:hypothetical protein BpHYR1_052259 [Brachionus plicatilis]|uniref:Uncharacterized protein n=1 Tax=Brachionus plicatilis TaxID=10195 RepID=A0A3M7TAX8_BRAPC|nr:hypothetical protein BpHYR1_052259 [Brachionus plicatilis]